MLQDNDFYVLKSKVIEDSPLYNDPYGVVGQTYNVAKHSPLVLFLIHNYDMATEDNM